MSDQYFKKKAEEIRNKISDFKVDNNGKMSFEDIDKIIYMGLKEVARDQRYACIYAVGKYTDSAIYGLIQNAGIKK